MQEMLADSYFWEKINIKNGGINPNNLETVGVYLKRLNIDSVDICVLPINANGNNWRVIIVNFKEKAITNYDSLLLYGTG